LEVTENLLLLKQRLSAEECKGTIQKDKFLFERLFGLLSTNKEGLEGNYLLTDFVEGKTLPSHGRFMLTPRGLLPDPYCGRVYDYPAELFVSHFMPNLLRFEHTDAHGGNFLKDTEGRIHLVDPIKFRRLS
jgi:hypothetical protein